MSKLLLDEHLSYRLAKKLQAVFPGTRHVSSVQLLRANDSRIWQFAREEQFTLVTCDFDFVNIAALKGHPPKIIRLQTKGLSTHDIATLLSRNQETIEAFVSDVGPDSKAVLMFPIASQQESFGK